jgi:hypothetical protein
MLIDSYGKMFTADAKMAVSSVFEKNPLGETSTEILEMVRCYANDGMILYCQGDLVNAVASFAYGHGWLDAGVYLGYVGQQHATTLPVISENIPDTLFDHLTEKTNRYQRMLFAALEMVVILPDAETRMFRAAQNIRTIVAVKLAGGNELFFSEDLINALVSFSYGHGWLDAGVRVGLFGIIGNRHLFAI